MNSDWPNAVIKAPRPQETPSEAGLSAVPGSRWFLDPDGDLLARKPVENIWIVEERKGLFRRLSYRILLQFEGSAEPDWEIIRDNIEDAEEARSHLIEALCENTEAEHRTP